MPTFRIKQLAQERGFTTEGLARRSNVKFGTVRNLWQNRTHDPNYTTMKALARTLQVSIEELEACEEERQSTEETPTHTTNWGR